MTQVGSKEVRTSMWTTRQRSSGTTGGTSGSTSILNYKRLCPGPVPGPGPELDNNLLLFGAKFVICLQLALSFCNALMLPLKLDLFIIVKIKSEVSKICLS